MEGEARHAVLRRGREVAFMLRKLRRTVLETLLLAIIALAAVGPGVSLAEDAHLSWVFHIEGMT